MIKKLLAVVALASAALTFMPADPVDARGRSGGGGGGGFRAGGGGGGIRAAGGFRGGPVFRAGPSFRAGPVFRPARSFRPAYYGRSYRRLYVAPLIVSGVGCQYLRQRALATGSPYWWRRYRACRGD